MHYRRFGSTGINVSVLGLGAGQLGNLSFSDKDSDVLLNTAVDMGINLIDTARAYSASEERIGRFLSHRRQDCVYSTKAGYGIEGIGDWTYESIIAGVEEALIKLRTDYIDILHLHSCPLQVLQQQDVIYALEKVRSEGKIIAAAYSGENDALAYAVSTGRFQSIMTSVNITDQHSIETVLPESMKHDLGVIAKRPLANAFWRFTSQPFGDYSEQYWLRWKQMELDFNIAPDELFLRFAAYTPGVHSCITGTTDTEHLKRNIDIIEKGSLPEDVYNSLRDAFKEHDNNWTGLT
jgi:aryl-alcohol dehydrogenase-like predicted oxidoreductase